MQSETLINPAPTKLMWIGRIISGLVGASLILDGATKLFKPAPVLEAFARLGWDESYAISQGILEIACAVIYLVPRTSILGAILLTAFLGGGAAALVRIGDIPYAPVILGVLAWGGLFLRDNRLRWLLPLRS